MLDKEKIVNFNNKLGIKTEFFYGDEDVLGYSEGNTIYLNLNSNQDFEKTNRHEVLHFFEDTEEFQIIKKQLINIKNLDKLRNDYKFKYFGLYTEEDINKGILDTEIVIDMLSNNSIVVDNDLVKVGDIILTSKIKELESRRYLNLSLNKNLSNMKGLSNWDKIFALNYYTGKDYFGKSHVMRSGDKVSIIKEDIDLELNNLYSFVDRPEVFKIDINSPELIRRYESEIKALNARGDKEEADYLRKYRKESLEEMSYSISNSLYEEYKYIVNLIKETDYEASFKALMLRENLLKTYKKEKIADKDSILVDRRKLNQSIMGYMTLNEIVLDTIYKNVNDYKDFANLYYAGLNIFKQNFSNKGMVSLEHVNTYGMGHWIKFEGKQANEEEYIENAKKLSALVQDTPWCTKTSASQQLAEGDFYLFIGNDNKPHIAVKLSGNEIEEVRGVKGGNAQELENEYREVVISFLENNKEINNGIKWLEKEEWNKRLVQYNNEIKNGIFKDDEIEGLLDDLTNIKDYKPHTMYKNYNLFELKSNLGLIQDKLAKYYDCREEEICLTNISFNKNTFKDETKFPYRVILGNVSFTGSGIKSLGKLQFVGGNANFGYSNIEDLGELKSIGGDVNFVNSKVLELKKLKYIGGYVSFYKSIVKDLGELQYIGRDADFSNSNVEDLGNLQYVGGDAIFRDSKITTMGNLQVIEGNASLFDSAIKSLGKLQYIGENVSFRNTNVEDLGELKRIEGTAIFHDSKIKSLRNLQYIGKNADLSNSKINDLGELIYVGKDANFDYSEVTELKKLHYVGGDLFYNHSRLAEFGTIERDDDGYIHFYQKHNLKR